MPWSYLHCKRVILGKKSEPESRTGVERSNGDFGTMVAGGAGGGQIVSIVMRYQIVASLSACLRG